MLNEWVRREAHNCADFLELGRNRLVLNRIAFTDQKVEAKARCTLSLGAVCKPVVVLAPYMVPSTTVPADVVTERCNGPYAVDELELADFVQELGADVSVKLSFRHSSGANSFGKREDRFSLEYRPGV